MASPLSALASPQEGATVLRKGTIHMKGRAEDVLGVEIRKGVWSDVVTITPDMARQLLERMPQQRELKRAAIRKYSAALRANAWKVSHQGLAFDALGRLIDGQNRLTACVETEIDLLTMVTFGLPSETFEVVDRTSVRTVADDLQVRGVAEGRFAKSLASAALLIDRIDRGLHPMVNILINQAPLPSGLPMVEAVRRLHPLLSATNELLLTERAVAPKPPLGTLVGFVTLFREVDDSLALAFANQLMTGEALRQGDPAAIIRESLVKTRGVENGNSNTRSAFMYRLVRGWNAVRAGRKTRTLFAGNFQGTGFPAISGYKPKRMH